MSRIKLFTAALAAWAACSAPALAIIVDVVETGGDNEPTDTIVAQWTGVTWTVTIENEPVPGAVVGSDFTVGVFENLAPSYVDRNHRYADDTANNLSIPAYLVGNSYIMSGNDNRDNADYQLNVTVDAPAIVYMLIDNRLGGSDNATPPAFGPTAMQWILDGDWSPVLNGLNRTGNPAVPDEVPIDEGADGTINQYFSVYRKDFPAGTFSLFQPDNGGQNMYGVVVAPVPEPGTLTLAILGLFALLAQARSRVG